MPETNNKKPDWNPAAKISFSKETEKLDLGTPAEEKLALKLPADEKLSLKSPLTGNEIGVPKKSVNGKKIILKTEAIGAAGGDLGSKLKSWWKKANNATKKTAAGEPAEKPGFLPKIKPAPKLEYSTSRRHLQTGANSYTNPKILDLDLIKDEVEVVFDWKKNLQFLGGFILITALLIAEVYVTLYLWEQNEIYSKTESLRQETALVDTEIATAKANASEATDFMNKINSLSSFFGQHIYWTDFFKYIEKNTLADVSYSGFKGDTGGSYSLTSFVQDFRAIGVQLKTFLADSHSTQATVSNEKINNGGKSVGVNFNLNLVINRNLFTE